MKGRKPKPIALKKLAGNPGGRKLNDNEPSFTLITNIKPPEWLSENALTMWQTVVPELLTNKILTVGDIHNVEAFCMAYSRWRLAEDDIKENGITIHTEKTVIKNPAVTVVNEATNQMMKFGALLGLDPSNRQRLSGAAKDKTPDNPWGEL